MRYRSDVGPDEILEVPALENHKNAMENELEPLELIPSILAKVLIVVIILRNRGELSRFITRLILGNQKAVKS